jgi:hypothetical protein
VKSAQSLWCHCIVTSEEHGGSSSEGIS